MVWNKGLTKETDQRVAKNAKNVSKGSKGKILTKEHKLKISQSMIGKNLGNISKTGQKDSLKTKIRKRQAALGKKLSEETKQKIRISRVNQKFLTKATSIEIKLWVELKRRNIKFKKNKPILGLTRPDAFIEPNICIYADGDYWHNIPSYKIRDKRQNRILKSKGFKVFRFWQHEINNNIKKCVDKIKRNRNLIRG